MIGPLGGHLGRKGDGELRVAGHRHLARLDQPLRDGNCLSRGARGRDDRFELKHTLLLRAHVHTLGDRADRKAHRQRSVAEPLSAFAPDLRATRPARPDGGLKDMSCHVALLRMQSDGRIRLPADRCARPGAFRIPPQIEDAVLAPASEPVVNLRGLTIETVDKKADSLLWNAFIERHHYLGRRLVPGAQLRYFVCSAGQILALLSFGASAWKIKPRDEFIGWTRDERERNLHRMVNNARFLILPWIRHRNLASRALTLISRRLPDDWQARYG